MTNEQSALTLLIPVRAEALETLRARLSQVVDEGIGVNTLFPFQRMTTIHFGRWFILEEMDDSPPRLGLATNYDGSLEGHIGDMIERADSGLDVLLECCCGYPDAARRNEETRREFLIRHEIPTQAFYVGARWRTVRQVRREAELRAHIQEFLDHRISDLAEPSPSARDLYREIREHVKTDPEFSWALEPVTKRSTRDWTEYIGTFLVHALRGLLLVPIVPFWFVFVRYHEMRDPLPIQQGDSDHVRALVRREDRIGQNQLTMVSQVKPGWFRMTTLRLVLWAIHVAARYVFNRGRLAGVPTIHFARFFFIDGRRRVVFLSNFDGSWEQYLGDFIDIAAFGLTAVWTNTTDFPPTRFLFSGGARDEQGFKSLIRRSQLHTRAWYSAYPELSVENVNRNSRVRSGLGKPLSERAAKAWLEEL